MPKKKNDVYHQRVKIMFTVKEKNDVYQQRVKIMFTVKE